MKKLFFVFIFVQFVLSCSKKSDDTPAPYLNVNQPKVSLLPYPGASGDVIIESNIEWQVSISPNDWLQLNKTSGNGNDTIHVIAKNANTPGQIRSATLTITPSNTSTK